MIIIVAISAGFGSDHSITSEYRAKLFIVSFIIMIMVEMEYTSVYIGPLNSPFSHKETLAATYINAVG